MATLAVNSTADFTHRLLAFIDVIDFINAVSTAAIATFGSWQFGAGKISPSVLIDGSAGTNAVAVNANGLPFDASGWSFVNWSGADSITVNGTSFSDILTGSSRDDTINGGTGSDTIDGGLGADTVNGGSGMDRLSGGAGIDTLSYAGSSAGVTVNLATDLVSGGDASGDQIDSFENVTGSSANDKITGDDRANLLDGGVGADQLNGGAGADRLIGGLAGDKLTGGLGADRFIYREFNQSVAATGRDVINDFSQAQGDLINVAAIDAIAGGVDNAFVFIGNAAFSAAGQLRYFNSGTQTIIQADGNGDGIADMEIVLAGSMTLVAADFIL